jgi:uncharacterized membrane protein
MYTIIGADHKEYGPVSAEDVAQWIAEGRADGRTHARAQTDGEWKPLSAFPEFAAALAAAPKVPGSLPGAARTASPEEILARDYEIDIGSCLSRSWVLVKQNFWPVVGISFLILVITNVINQGLALISKPEMDALMKNLMAGNGFPRDGYGLIILTSILGVPVFMIFNGGLYLYYLRLIRGEESDLSDAFSGVTRSFVPLLLLGLVMGTLIILGFVLCIIPGLYLSVSWYFAMALVVDKNMNFWEAMELSRKAVSKHWFTMFALILVLGLVGAVGICGFCIGIFVTVPIASIALMYAYEDIFGRRAG